MATLEHMFKRKRKPEIQCLSVKPTYGQDSGVIVQLEGNMTVQELRDELNVLKLAREIFRGNLMEVLR